MHKVLKYAQFLGFTSVIQNSQSKTSTIALPSDSDEEDELPQKRRKADESDVCDNNNRAIN